MKIRHSVLAFVLALSTAASATALADNDAHLVAGVTAFKAGNMREAVSELKQSLAASPSVNAALYLGNAYLKMQALGPAKAAFNRALQIDPGTPKKAGILDLIHKIDQGDYGKAPTPAPAAAKSPAPPAAPKPAAAPVPPPPAPTQPETPTDKLADLDCQWAPYKEAWSCALPASFEGGRFATPPDYRHDDDSEQRRRHSWVAALKVNGARRNGRVGAFVPQKDGSWLFVPGPLWSPHDLVTMPPARPADTGTATASTTPTR
jgi:hypothetical protein